MKKAKRIGMLFSAGMIMFFLAGCSRSTVTQNSSGIWDHYIIWNFIKAIQFLSRVFGDSYGWGIIVFTIIVRVILLPLMFYQTKSMRKTSELQPKLKKLQKKYSAKDSETQSKLREEQQKLYAEAGVNPVAGCLPILVQMPILLALYQAILRSQVLKTGSFLWMQLGDRDPYFVLPILAAIFTFGTSKLSVMSQPEQNGMTAAMTYGMPAIILFSAISLPSALSLYWVITNAFSVGQTMLINNPFKINKEREEKKKAEKARKRALEKAKRKAYRSKKK
ncbi:Stage III sporulation protein J [Liquorilactobacillus aquaticus DSM 21051]|uniref:Membrane protein insertase YidC n=1 Tax=Liquorilactobacillus aquaticus DSM 21051 TaxID=1423725 RepID=A0A0R2D4W7_9LACO|nr:membrane protein insertase YidC [Liquorilactobacillus aquaticus]KRM96980.1 Stage III sporulation protein J [Liquorilactobacillus aquaticus DSM 21051]